MAGLIGAASFVLWGKARQNAEILLRADRLKCSLPVIGKFIRSREAGGFARALGTLLVCKSAADVRDADRACAGHQPASESLYESAIKRVPEGMPLHRAFDGTGLCRRHRFASSLSARNPVNSVPCSSRSPALFETDLQRHIERMVGLLTPALTLVIGGSIGALIMHVMSAVLSINNLAFQ